MMTTTKSLERITLSPCSMEYAPKPPFDSRRPELAPASVLADTEKLYKRVLNSDPNNVEALRLLGVLASQVGRHDVAAQLVGKAISLRPTWGEAWGA